MGQKTRNLEIVSEETEDQFKKEFYPALFNYEKEIISKEQDEPEDVFHLMDWLRYQGIKDFIMKPFNPETPAKSVINDKRLFIMNPEVTNFDSERPLAPITIEVRKLCYQADKDKSYGLMIIELLVENQEDWSDMHKELADFEKLLIRYQFLKFLADIEKDNQELQKLFKEVSDDYEIQREVLKMSLMAILKAIPQLEPYKHYYEEVTDKIKKAESQKIALMKKERVEIKLAVDYSMLEPPKKKKNQKIKTSEKILSFALFKKELEDQNHE